MTHNNNKQTHTYSLTPSHKRILSSLPNRNHQNVPSKSFSLPLSYHSHSSSNPNVLWEVPLWVTTQRRMDVETTSIRQVCVRSNTQATIKSATLFYMQFSRKWVQAHAVCLIKRLGEVSRTHTSIAFHSLGYNFKTALKGRMFIILDTKEWRTSSQKFVEYLFDMFHLCDSYYSSSSHSKTTLRTIPIAH